jgi:hypothetical protein
MPYKGILSEYFRLYFTVKHTHKTLALKSYGSIPKKCHPRGGRDPCNLNIFQYDICCVGLKCQDSILRGNDTDRVGKYHPLCGQNSE